MIGQCDALTAEFGRTTAQTFDATRAIEQRIFRVNVQVDELIQTGLPSGRKRIESFQTEPWRRTPDGRRVVRDRTRAAPARALGRIKVMGSVEERT